VLSILPEELHESSTQGSMDRRFETRTRSTVKFDPSKLLSSPVLFLDFDGVIKESVPIKAEGFSILFSSFGEDIRKKVMRHQLTHGGMSRFEKIPLYLEWARVEADGAAIEHYCAEYSVIVKQLVIDSEWVPGVLDYLNVRSRHQQFVIVSATPQQEMEEIMDQIGILHLFDSIFGSPTKKGQAIQYEAESRKISLDQCFFIGDSNSDLVAAQEAKVPFILRSHQHNELMTRSFDGPIISDFTDLWID